jgi:hypothetical protein
MEDVLDVYERSLSAEEPVACVDEKPMTLHNDVREDHPNEARQRGQARQ